MQPPAYQIITDFSEEEANAVSGRSTVRTAALDQEFSAIELTLEGVLTNLSAIQRDDGELGDGVVKTHTLATDVLLLIGSGGFTVHDPVEWDTAIDYEARELVTESGATYVSVTAHTSGVFATDLAAGKWLLLFSADALTAAQVSNTPAGNISSATVQAALNELDTKKVGKATLTAKADIMTASAAATPAVLGVGTDGLVLSASAAEATGMKWAKPCGPVASGRNIAARTNASNPTTAIDITADELVLRHASGGAVLAQSVSVTISITSSGANGLDTGAEAGNTWYYGWVIAKEDGTIAGLLSASATAPTMPADYVYKALVSAVRNNGSSNFIAYTQKGDTCYFNAAQSILSGGSATTENSSASTAAAAPSIAGTIQVTWDAAAAATSGPVFGQLRHVSGSNFFTFRVSTSSAGAETNYGNGSVEMPYVANVLYLWDSAFASRSLSLFVTAFRLPIGGQ